MSTATQTRPLFLTETPDERRARGIMAIQRALEDARAGTLVCDCPECELRRIAEEQRVCTK